MNDNDAQHPAQSAPARRRFAAELDTSAVLHVRGELDLSTAPALLAALDQVARTGCVVRVDLAEVTFMDSSGVHVLADAAQAVGERGRIVLLRASAAIRSTLELCGLGGSFEHQ